LKYVQKYLEELPDDLSNFENEKIEESYLLLAGFFGFYPKQTSNLKDKYSNLGKSFYEYELKINKGKKMSNDDLSTTGTEKRFMALLKANEEDLPEDLKQSIQLLSSQEVEPFFDPGHGKRAFKIRCDWFALCRTWNFA
jgi:hypothetical protein